MIYEWEIFRTEALRKCLFTLHCCCSAVWFRPCGNAPVGESLVFGDFDLPLSYLLIKQVSWWYPGGREWIWSSVVEKTLSKTENQVSGRRFFANKWLSGGSGQKFTRRSELGVDLTFLVECKIWCYLYSIRPVNVIWKRISYQIRINNRATKSCIIFGKDNVIIELGHIDRLLNK